MAFASVGDGIPFHVDLDIEGRRVVSGGVASIDFGGSEWHELEEAVGAREVEYELNLPGDGGEAEVFFSDLSHEYVRINAEYTS
jgi:glutamate N-acetyltransferase/amino-acid N-acetyltransferase